MAKRSVKWWRKYPVRRAGTRRETAFDPLPAEFLRGVAHRLGSGAVTLLILWWETRH